MLLGDCVPFRIRKTARVFVLLCGKHGREQTRKTHSEGARRWLACAAAHQDGLVSADQVVCVRRGVFAPPSPPWSQGLTDRGLEPGR